jgi:predicted Zn-dependent peptidase
VRHKDIEQSHICVGTPAYPQVHNDRHALYLLNTIFGGSMSSRLFQHIREERGLAYAVFSTLTTYTDAGIISVYAGCATEKVNDVVALTLAEMNTLREEQVPADELRRAKDHLKGSLMLGLESTSSRMSHVARQELYFRRQFTLDEMLESIERVTQDDVQRVARDLFRDDGLAATVVGPETETPFQAERLRIGGR